MSLQPERRLRPRTRTTSGSVSAPVPKRKRQAKKPVASAKEPTEVLFDMTAAKSVCANSSKAGLPTREEYEQVEQAYLDSLSSRKREKALLTQTMFDDVWDVLHNPRDSKLRTPQFRFWVRKMFVLSYANQGRTEDDTTVSAAMRRAEEDLQPVILHEDRPVALREQIYDIVSYFHRVSGHGGRDKTMAHVRARYSWIPKELIAQYVKICPTCVHKKGKGRSGSPLSAAHSIPALPGSESTRWADNSDSMDADDSTFDASANKTPRCYQIFPPLSTPLRSGGRSRMQDTLALPPLLPRASSSSGGRRGSGSGSGSSHGEYHDYYDSRGWLSGLTALPGPNSSHGFPGRSPDLTLPPMRRTGSENDAEPIRSRSGVTLPPLMKALSDEGANMSQTLMYPPLSPFGFDLKGTSPTQTSSLFSGFGSGSFSGSGTSSDHGSLSTTEAYAEAPSDPGFAMNIDLDIDPVLLGTAPQGQAHDHSQPLALAQAASKPMVEAQYSWDFPIPRSVGNTQVDFLLDTLPMPTSDPVSMTLALADGLAMRPVVDTTPVKLPHRTLIPVPAAAQCDAVLPPASSASAELYLSGTDVLPQPPSVLMSSASELLSEAGSLSTIQTGASGSIDAQDWEAQYCLDDSPR